MRQRAVALLLRGEGRVEVADRADDGLLERLVAQAVVARARRVGERFGGRRVNVERRLQVGVAVRREGDRARVEADRAAAAVRAAHDAHVVPQVAAREELGDRVQCAVGLLARGEEVTARRDVVDLRRDDEPLV
eukprot:7377956-Prymnesium_polylepis.1